MFQDHSSGAVERGSCAATSSHPIEHLPQKQVAPQAEHDEQAPLNPVVARLKRLGMIGDKETTALEHFTCSARACAPNHTLFSEGGTCDHVCFLLEGVACRYRMLANGSRQILGYILPGEMCDLEFLTIGESDHNVSLLTNGLVVKISRAKMLGFLYALPALHQALIAAAMIDKAILRQWLLNIGQRSASNRLSHLLCEITVRMQDVAPKSPDGSIPFGINQLALADTLGMSTVHVNRVLQDLRAANLIVLRKRRLTIVDRDRLEAVAEFEPRYLRPRQSAG